VGMRSTSATVLVPRALLQAGATYAVSIIASDQTYRWSFKMSQ